MLKMAYYNRTTATAARTTNAIIKWQPHLLLSPIVVVVCDFCVRASLRKLQPQFN